MSSVQTALRPPQLRDALPDPGSGTWSEYMAQDRGQEMGCLPSDRDFVAMRAGYRATGGVALGEDLARLLEDVQHDNFVGLASLIASGEVFGFEWRQRFWVPIFQFELRDLSVKAGPRKVMTELSSVFDGWTIAVWFSHPNSWLNERRPVDLLDSNLPAVLHAACADRLIATG